MILVLYFVARGAQFKESFYIHGRAVWQILLDHRGYERLASRTYALLNELLDVRHDRHLACCLTYLVLVGTI